MGYKHNIETIVERGMRLFQHRGYHAVGINDILKACAIPKGSFYNFFESKEQFAEQVIHAYGAMSERTIRRCLETDGSPVQRLKNFYSTLINYNEQDGLTTGCLVNTFANEMGGQSDKLAEVSDENFRKWLTIIAKTVQEGQEAGEITDSMSAMDIAEYLHAGFNGTFSRMKVTRNRDYMDRWHKMTFQFIQK